ncbi:MAG: PD-(D/E)XK nuclease family protein [Bacteroidales bacterium]|jgi:CRISPR-associated exonuclease Cas4|nr:PD-(D/E)XK nuclease family protein [Bacteroidales bacterium]
MTKLDAFINKNLPKVLAEHTVNSLGDRSTYIGASDIGGCLRASYLGKKQKAEYDISQHIVFERGHLSEGIVAKMLEGTPYKTQVEAVGKAYNDFPIKAHIDFVVDFGKEVVIVEAKSTSNPIEQPYDSWVLQTQLQMDLLKKNKEFSNKAIRGYIIAIDVNSGWYKTFEVEPNGTLLNIAMAKANALANALQTNKCPDGEVQLYCSRCPFKADCETISKGKDKQLPFDIKSVVGRLKELQATEKEIKKCKETVKTFMEATNTSVAKADTITVALKYNSGDNYSIDTNKLRVEQPDIYARYRVPAKKYSYVQII